MAVRADDFALDDLNQQPFGCFTSQHLRDIRHLDTADMVEVHHLRRVCAVTVGVGSALGLHDQGLLFAALAFPPDHYVAIVALAVSLVPAALIDCFALLAVAVAGALGLVAQRDSVKDLTCEHNTSASSPPGTGCPSWGMRRESHVGVAE